MLKTIDMDAYLERYEQIKNSLSFIELDQETVHLSPVVSELREDFRKLTTSFKRMKPENFIARADQLIDRAEKLRILIKETINRFEFMEYMDEGEDEPIEVLKKETVSIEPEELKEETKTKGAWGGARPRSGPKVKHGGVKRPVSVTLGQGEWDAIDNLVHKGIYESRADFFRTQALNELRRGRYYQ